MVLTGADEAPVRGDACCDIRTGLRLLCSDGGTVSMG